PTTAAATTAARPAHCHGPAASDRSATETGARAFVDEPTRMSGRGAEPGGGAGGSPTIRQPPGVGAERPRRTREKALATDGLSAALTRSVRPGIEPCERPVDSRERLLGALLETRAELTLERDRRRVGADPARHADLLVHRPLPVLLHRRE